jgi:hypothetical protein
MASLCLMEKEENVQMRCVSKNRSSDAIMFFLLKGILSRIPDTKYCNILVRMSTFESTRCFVVVPRVWCSIAKYTEMSYLELACVGNCDAAKDKTSRVKARLVAGLAKRLAPVPR